MAHLSGFGLENFRVFKEYTWFDFAPITILVGPNNSGKSSLIKALLLLKENKDNLKFLDLTKVQHVENSFKRLIHCQSNSDVGNLDVVTFKMPFFDSLYYLLTLKYNFNLRSNVPTLIDFDLEDNEGYSWKGEMIEKVGYQGDFDGLARSFKGATGGKFMPHLNYLYYLPVVKNNEPFIAPKHDTYEYYIRQNGLLKKWINYFGIKLDEVVINNLTDEKVVTINNRLPSEVGTGIRQIVLLLLSMVDKFPLSHDEADDIAQDGGQIFILEEPETNLHPKFQSQLADLYADSFRSYNANFIIETHSEYLIRKLQYLTAKGEIKPEDTVIYYFNNPNNISPGEKQVKKINILEDGSLSDDFGPGFYDEATHWKFELLRLKNSRKN